MTTTHNHPPHPADPLAVRIRLAANRHADAVLALQDEAYAGPIPLGHYRPMLRRGPYNADILIAETTDGRVAGCALILSSDPDQHTILVALAVAAADRRRGVARELLDFLTTATPPGYTVDACVPDDRLPAQLLFRASGFTCGEILPNFFDGHRDAYRFTFTTQPRRQR